MTISVKTYVPGEVLFSVDLNAHLTILVDEINRLAALPHNANLFGRNLFNNGDFSLWERAITQTTSGYGSDDRWKNENTGSTKVASQQTFTVGQSVVTDNPTFFSRTVVTTSAGAANFVSKSQRIEGVQKTSGEAVTLQFWAKADATKNVALEFIQHFGTGGSPSSDVTGTGITTIALTTSWVKHTLTVTIPSITGKALGTDLNDFLEFRIWMDAGTDFNARTSSLGQQSGTFEFANMQIELGSSATDFEYVQPADQLARCYRFFQKIISTSGSVFSVGQAFGTTNPEADLHFSVKRSIPTITQGGAGTLQWRTAAGGATGTVVISLINTQTASLTASGASGLVAGNAVAITSVGGNIEISIEAEL